MFFSRQLGFEGSKKSYPDFPGYCPPISPTHHYINQSKNHKSIENLKFIGKSRKTMTVFHIIYEQSEKSMKIQIFSTKL